MGRRGPTAKRQVGFKGGNPSSKIIKENETPHYKIQERRHHLKGGSGQCACQHGESLSEMAEK